MDFDCEDSSGIEQFSDAIEQISLQPSSKCGDNNILDIIYTDAKSLKRFYMYLEKMHTETSIEFYRNGMWGKIIGLDKDRREVRYVSSLQFPAVKLFRYECHLEKLPDYNPEEDDTTFFTLTFKTSNMVEFLKSTGAGSNVYFKYNLGSKTALLTEREDKPGGYDLEVKFSTTGTQFPIEGEICNEELLPIINVMSDKFSSIAENLTKVKKQSIHTNYLDFQYNEDTREKSLYVHSSENKFKEPFGNYIRELQPDVRFIIEFTIMKALASLPKVNDKGFLSFFFIDEDMLRASVCIGNFGMYHLYIIPRKST